MWLVDRGHVVDGRRRSSSPPTPTSRTATTTVRWSPSTAAPSGPRRDGLGGPCDARRGCASTCSGIRRRRAPDGPAAHRVDRRGAVPRGGPGVLLDRPGRARPRRHAVRAAAATTSTRLAFRAAAVRLPQLPPRRARRAPTGPTPSSATGCTTSPRTCRWEALAASTEPSVAAVVARARREEAYHRRHADALVVRMLGDRDGGERVAAAIRRLLPFADAVWDPVDGRAGRGGRRHRGRVVRRVAATLAA